MATNRDPSPEEIEQLTAEIRATWTPEEHWRRLRPDLRPSCRLADGRLQGISSEDYRIHHDERAAILQAMADP